MFVGYISNSKCVSSISLPGIYLLKRSLRQMFMSKEQISYKHVPDYINKLKHSLYFIYCKENGIYLLN